LYSQKLQKATNRAVARLPQDVRDGFLKQAAAYHGAGKFDLAASLYEHVEKHNPEAFAATYYRALIDIEAGRLSAAASRLRRLIKKDPGSAEPNYSLGYVYQELGNWRKAVEQYQRVLEISPGRSIVMFMLSKGFEVLGRIDDAYALLRELASMPTARLRALSQIAQLRPKAVSEDERAEMNRAANDTSTPLAVRITLYFALGELLEHAKKYDEAFSAFTSGNTLRRQNLSEAIDEPQRPVIAPPSARPRKWHPEKAAQEHAASIATAKRIFTPEFLAQHQSKGDNTRAPIFVVGMPRSGSTLIEQILSSHGAVTGLGECNALWGAISNRFPYATLEPLPDHFRALAQTYLARLRGFGWEETSFVVDKMLGNYMAIGMIHLMFPNATILHSVRNPVDNCLACYRKLFKSGNETTFDLADVGAQYVRYRDMMAYWNEVLPGRVTDVVHEDFVSDPDNKIRWLITKACRLKWDENCLRFYETTRPVRTASIAQVRQPIFRTSVERWRHYESKLAPLFESLGKYGPV
jgi:Flp pilus assembly protein TadD